MNDQIKSGYVAIVGKPNVGKSTLMNQMMGSKISITSNNAQTTRGCVSGNIHGDDFALKVVDTPGYVKKSKHLLDRMLNKTVTGWIENVDVVLFVIDARSFGGEDEVILEHLSHIDSPVFLVLNKVDLIKDKASILPLLEDLAKKTKADEIIPISASKGINLDKLRSALLGHLPYNHPLESDIILNTPREIIVAERVREKIFRYFSAEIPRSSVVVVREYRSKKNVDYIKASIIVERKSHRKIIIGKQGSKLKEIGISARQELEKIFDKKIFLELFVEVEENWSNKESALAAYQIFYNQQY